MSLLPVGISGEEAGYQIERSLRFNSADSPYMYRGYGSNGTSRKIFTLSFWVKRAALGAEQYIYDGDSSAGSNAFYVRFDSNDTLRVRDFSSSGLFYNTTQVFRDPSAWYHIVVAINTTLATGGDRQKIYLNGQQITAWGTSTAATQNTDTNVYVSGKNALIGTQDGSSEFLSAYLAEFHVVDGSQLDPTSFGEYNEDTGVWQPKAYTGSYGTNGFYLNFSDNSGVTSTTLGADSSGNGNNWTPNNFSVTAGAGNDSLVDTPTNYGTDTGLGGEVRGNYATLNPLDKGTTTLSNGNLDCVVGTTATIARATIGVSSGKWYWECVFTNISGAGALGIALASTPTTSHLGVGAGGYAYLSTGNKRDSVNGAVTYGDSYTTNDVIGVAFDSDSGTLTFYKNNVSQGVAFTGLTSDVYFPAVSDNIGVNSSTLFANFGQRPFAYTAPSGFKALCTQNLPEPTIVDGGEYFNTVLYTGNGSTQSITGVGFQPDWVWIKSRSSGALYHALFDSIRGINKRLFTNTTDAEDSTADTLVSFDTNGFTLGAQAGQNNTGSTFVAWNWKANGAGVSNTAGTITSTVSANTDSGFSIVTYTGNGSAGATIGHGLGVAPNMVIVKRRDSATNGDWFVWTTMTGAGNNLFLNLTSASSAAAGPFNSTAPSSTLITLGNSTGTNANTSTYVAYCFAQIPGYSAFGSYTGNGSADGPFVYTGFRPAWVLIKQSSAAGENWRLIDSTRSPFNQANRHLAPSSSAAESTETGWDIVSNGFKLRNSDAHQNGNGATYIYACFAESPFKIALAR